MGRSEIVKSILAVLTLGLLLLMGGGVYAGDEATGDAELSVLRGPANNKPHAASPDDPIGFVLDDGYAETSLGFGNTTYNHTAAAIWLNKFSVGNNVPYPLTLTGIHIAFPGFQSGNFVGDQIQLLIYLDADRDGNPANAVMLYQSLQTITVADWDTFQFFPINLQTNTRGDLYVGWEDKWAEGGPSPLEYIAGLDITTPRHSSWLIANTVCCTPNIYNLGANDYRKKTDDIGYPGNFMIRLTGDSYSPATPTPVIPTATNTSTPTYTPVPPRCPGETFTDVCPGDYFYQPVLALNADGIVSGYTTSPPCETQAHVPCYRPASNVTRGQVSKIISLAVNFNEPVTGQSFEDIPPGSTFYQYIERLAGRGITSGYPCGGSGEPCVPPDNRPYYRPNNSLTRGQLSKIASESFGYQDVITGQTFEDVSIGSTFYTYIERLAMRLIINGYNCGGPGEPCVGPGNRPYFRPAANVTRAQTAKIVQFARELVPPTPTITNTPTNTPINTSTATSTYTSEPSLTTMPTGTQTSTPVETMTTIPTSTHTPITR